MPFQSPTIDANPEMASQFAYAGVCEQDGPEVSASGFRHQGIAVDEFGKDN